MEFDIKAKAEEITKKLSVDKNLAADFRKEPIKTLEKLTGKDLPDEKIQALLAGVKERLPKGDLGDKIDAAKDKLGDKLESGKLGEKIDAAKDKLGDKLENSKLGDKIDAAKDKLEDKLEARKKK